MASQQDDIVALMFTSAGYSLVALIGCTLVLMCQSQGPDNSLDTVWISKVFSDNMWGYAPSSTRNKECTRQGDLYRTHLRNSTLWAVQMLDASVITPSGLIDGDNTQFGHADQCIQTRVPIRNFRTQFCLPTATFSPQSHQLYPEFYDNQTRDWPPYDMDKTVWSFLRPRDKSIRLSRLKFSWGLCVPEVCTANDIQTSLDTTLAEAFRELNISFRVELTSVMCYSGKEMEERHMPLIGKLWVLGLLLLVILMVMGTIVDYQYGTEQQAMEKQLKDTKKESTDKLAQSAMSFLTTFSFISNMRRLCRTSEDDNEVSIIHAIKYLTICGVIMFHREVFGMGYARNMAFFEGLLHKTSYFLLTSTTQTLDAFFYLAGFLLARVLIKERGHINILSTIVYRVIRLYPLILASIAFAIWVYPYLGEGPRWKSVVDGGAESCQQYWWHNLLFISSLFEDTELCISVMWFLSTEFQLFLLGLAIVALAEKFPSHRTVILSASFIIAHIVPSVFIFFQRETSFWMMTIWDIQNINLTPHIRAMYLKFYIRMPPYIFGACSAYVIDYLLKKQVKITGSQKVFAFMTMVPLNFIVFYIGALFLQPGVQYNPWHHALFAFVMRITYSGLIFVGLVIHSCGGFGAISDFLCHPIFRPLGRITFHMYLIHFFIITTDHALSQSSQYYNLYNYFLRVCGDIFSTTLLALATTLLPGEIDSLSEGK
ncbi:hypothetical protein M8J76_007836 [Diaphorina citri]|nr:hypothetical protein M8J76_007836 [Diaphorina citri]